MRRPSGLMLAGVLALGLLISSCASPPPAQLPPTPKEATAKAADSDYIIGPGDTLQVFVWRNPELSVTVPVRPDGKISTPLVEDMVAVGKTSPQLARDMEKVLGEYVRSPEGQHHRHHGGECVQPGEGGGPGGPRAGVAVPRRHDGA